VIERSFSGTEVDTVNSIASLPPGSNRAVHAAAAATILYNYYTYVGPTVDRNF